MKITAEKPYLTRDQLSKESGESRKEITELLGLKHLTAETDPAIPVAMEYSLSKLPSVEQQPFYDAHCMEHPAQFAHGVKEKIEELKKAKTIK